MRNKEIPSFIKKFLVWTREHSNLSTEQTLEKCKFNDREIWQKELISSYLKGRDEVRAGFAPDIYEEELDIWMPEF